MSAQSARAVWFRRDYVVCSHRRRGPRNAVSAILAAYALLSRGDGVGSTLDE